MHAAAIYDVGGDDKLMIFFTGLTVTFVTFETKIYTHYIQHIFWGVFPEYAF